MGNEPLQPNAAAIYLYRQVDRNDNDSVTRFYNRIKILTKEGRDQANIKIFYDKDSESIRSISARTIHPDGSITEFDGKAIDQIIAKGQGINQHAKVLILPAADVGSIIEYRYTVQMDSNYIFDSNWILNADLFTKRARFSLIQNDFYPLRWSMPQGLPANTEPPKPLGGKIVMEAVNIAAFVEEDYMPPDVTLKMRVDFYYVDPTLIEREEEKFWAHVNRNTYRGISSYVDVTSRVRKTVQSIVAPTDPEDTKARKIYAWVQKLRNLSFERAVSEAEARREDLNKNSDADDVIKNGYGDADQLNLLFVALARAADLEADAVHVSSRSRYFFDPRNMNARQLNTYVVQIKLANNNKVYVDPGVPMAPYGLLPWDETAISGLVVSKRDATWITTPLPPSYQSGIDRTAELTIDEAGSLSGRLKMSFRGLSALSMRLANREEDALARKTSLENIVRGTIPTGIQIELINQPDWTSNSPTLDAEFKIEIGGWAQSLGTRQLFAAGLFGAELERMFSATQRIYPVYLHFPHVTSDDIYVTLPANWRVATTPDMQIHNYNNRMKYTMWAEAHDSVLRIRRKLDWNFLLVGAKDYTELRTFFEDARRADKQQIILSRQENATPRTAKQK